jgi:putative hydrolase of the HAD superfamily
MKHGDGRAILFDLDDTLYRRRRFVLSGFRAVAEHLERLEGHGSDRTFAMLSRLSRGMQAGRELQACLARLQMPENRADELIAVFRAHRPALRLPGESRRTLENAARAGWRLGVVTNGAPSVQANKVAALGLELLAATIVYATEWGSGRGKPDRAPFLEALRRLDVPPDRAVFAGDDDWCDLAGAKDVGMRTVFVGRYRAAAPDPPRHADAIVTSLRSVPRVAAGLLTDRASRHAA